jgi:two-component system LytT family sensor kinase
VRPSYRAWGVVLGIWTIFGLLESVKTYVWLGTQGFPRVWWWILLSNIPWWYAWAALTPAVIWLGARWPLAGPRRWRAIGIHAAAAVVSAGVHVVASGALTYWVAGGRGAPTLSRQIGAFLVNYYIVDIAIYCAILGAYFAFDYARRWRESTLATARLEARATRLELGLADARLQALRMELNPHFLFNTLNAISGLVRKDQRDAAVQMLARLGDLLRATLDRKLPQEISVDDELALLQRYLEIELTRFGARLTVHVDADALARQALVPTLICQPLVENAVRHGASRRSGPVSVTVSARRDGAALVLEVRDTGRGLGAMVREGIGLTNTRERLRELYGDAATLHLAEAPGGGTIAAVRMPFRSTPNDQHDEQRDDQHDEPHVSATA